jgi:hypothetical protein
MEWGCFIEKAFSPAAESAVSPISVLDFARAL